MKLYEPSKKAIKKGALEEHERLLFLTDDDCILYDARTMIIIEPYFQKTIDSYVTPSKEPFPSWPRPVLKVDKGLKRMYPLVCSYLDDMGVDYEET